MNLPIEYSCPLGKKCVEARDGKIVRCAWLVGLDGKEPSEEKSMHKVTYRCAVAWLPIVAVENSQTNRGQTQEINILNKDITDHNRQMFELAQASVAIRLLKGE